MVCLNPECKRALLEQSIRKGSDFYTQSGIFPKVLLASKRFLWAAQSNKLYHFLMIVPDFNRFDQGLEDMDLQNQCVYFRFLSYDGAAFPTSAFVLTSEVARRLIRLLRPNSFKVSISRLPNDKGYLDLINEVDGKVALFVENHTQELSDGIMDYVHLVDDLACPVELLKELLKHPELKFDSLSTDIRVTQDCGDAVEEFVRQRANHLTLVLNLPSFSFLEHGSLCFEDAEIVNTETRKLTINTGFWGHVWSSSKNIMEYVIKCFSRLGSLKIGLIGDALELPEVKSDNDASMDEYDDEDQEFDDDFPNVDTMLDQMLFLLCQIGISHSVLSIQLDTDDDIEESTKRYAPWIEQCRIKYGRDFKIQTDDSGPMLEATFELIRPG